MIRPKALSIPILVVLAAACTNGGNGDGTSNKTRGRAETRVFDENDPIERACALPREQLVRLWRGHHRVHSEDVTTVPLPPNYSGSFTVTSHSGPWSYLQTVPLILYGPGLIEARGALNTPASITDIYATAGELTGVKLPARQGDVLQEAIVPGAPRPRVIVTVVWDGVGRNVLERWTGRWPTVRRMETEGTSFVAATVGSSPSITPATHSSLGTGAFPNEHGVTAIEYRLPDGTVRGAFSGRDPADLQLSTFADELDAAAGNRAQVGMLGWKSWHLGMLGHGSAAAGGDRDVLALIGGAHDNVSVTGNSDYYVTPDYFGDLPGIEAHADELDRVDGEADGEWLGHDILAQHDNPAWVTFETDLLLQILRREGFGDDDVTDLMFVNYKPSDIVSHQYGMDSDEMGEVIERQDAALARLLRYLDREVTDAYVVVLTADHGNTPPAERTGAWPLQQGQLQADIDAHFEVPEDTSLVRQTSAAGPFLNRQVMRQMKVSAAAVARFLNGYTIRENWDEGALPEGYEGRGDENVLAAAWASGQYSEVMRCAFGSSDPPEAIEA